MIIIDIFYVQPLDMEIIPKFVIEIVPPVREQIIVDTGGQSCNSFKHSTFDDAEEEVNFPLLCLTFDEKLIQFTPIFLSGCPDAILD